jgi:hypothetical protein
MLTALCHQVPPATAVMHHLGIFYLWHQFGTTPVARMVCAVGRWPR